MYVVDTVGLRKLMIDKGYNNISEMAEACHLSRDTVSDILKGKARPGAVAMYAIAEALDVEPDILGRIFFKRVVA